MKNSVIHFLIFNCFLNFNLLHSQTRSVNIDSLIHLVNVDVHDSFTINNLLYLSYLETYQNPVASIKYAQKVKREALKIGFEEAYLKSFYMIAKAHIGTRKLDSAFIQLDSLDSFSELNKYKEVQCDCYKAKGQYYADRYQYEKAIEYLLHSIKIGKEIGDFGCHGGCLITLGSLYENLQHHNQAMQYYDEALKALEGTKRFHIVADVYLAKANLLDGFQQINAIDSCIMYAKKAENEVIEYEALSIKAELYSQQGKTDISLDLYQKGYDIIFPYGFNASDASFLAQYAVLLRKNGNVEKAKKLIDKVHSLEGDGKDMAYYQSMATYYELSNQPEQSLIYLKSYTELSDSLSRTKMINAFIGHDLQYKTSQKEKLLTEQKLELEKEKGRKKLFAGGSLILFMLFSGLGVWYYHRRNLKEKLIALELNAERNERERLEQLDVMKTRFFSNVSHELKTPLTLIMGSIESILSEKHDETTSRKLSLAYKNADKLNDLIEESLDLTKIEENQVKLEVEVRDIEKDLRRTLMNFESLAESRSILLSHHIVHENQRHTFVQCDWKKLEKILNNFISNAIKFSENNGEVTLSASIGKTLIISVQDQGVGIEDHELNKIFNRFYQVQKEKNSGYGGTGIGLAYAKKLADLLNGQISVVSKLGIGSTFSIQLPVEIVNQSSESVSSESSIKKDKIIPFSFSDSKPKVLIVEDNLEMSEFLLHTLDPYYECSLASDGLEALKITKEKEFHLICSDVMMPNMDGFQLKEKINRDNALKKIPFLFLTARSMEEDKLLGLHLGVDDYITKPFRVSEYLARIRNLLKNYDERNKAFLTLGQSEGIDSKVFKAVEESILNNITNPNFKISELASELNYSQRQLNRIIKQLTGFTPVSLILELRLQKAYRLIKANSYATISEVRYEVGIESSSYFTRKFKERFGLNPSEV